MSNLFDQLKEMHDCIIKEIRDLKRAIIVLTLLNKNHNFNLSKAFFLYKSPIGISISPISTSCFVNAVTF